jgi:restriction endonuclease Mrr
VNRPESYQILSTRRFCSCCGATFYTVAKVEQTCLKCRQEEAITKGGGEQRKLLTLGEVSRFTGIAMPTLQRYKKVYQERIPSEGIGRRRRFPVEALEVFKTLRDENLGRRKRAGSDSDPREDVWAEINIRINSITEELVTYLARHPHHIYKLQPRKFEDLVAAIVADMGYEVELTPLSRDGGRDVLAVMATPLGKQLTIIECKRYDIDNRIGVELVRQFLWVLEQEDRANRGLIAATSYFTSGARELEAQHRWRLGLKDYESIVGWLSQYGKWKNQDHSGLWLPYDGL